MPLSYETVFSLINFAVLPAWLLLAVLPRSSITRTVVHSGLYPLLLGVFYTVTLVTGFAFGYSAEGGSFNSAAGVSQAFSHPHGILIGWSHYLVFDLFVGAWIARDAQRRGFPQLVLVPCLFFTLMLGPVGLLMYVLLRFALRKGGWGLFETETGAGA
ncbi:MAG: ABA4-like family protein [Hyphomonas sp.]|uniref:ABA4-like family protein n=1 Tax=Hyphomonas sp. TaxID=87 RepID=UPI0034A07C46